MDSDDSQRRTALVTGASQGIGKAIAAQLAEDGYNVIGCASTPGTAAAALAPLGANVVGIDADVSRASDVRRMIDVALDRFGHVDVVVNNAGVFLTMDFFDLSEERWTQTLRVNLTGAFLMAQAGARAMIDTDALSRGGGRIVNVSSATGILSKVRSADYNASKAGMISLTRSLAADLGRYGIASTCVAPGWIDTGIEPALAAFSPDEMERLNPMGRTGTPDEVAHAVSALCHPRAGFMNGAIVSVDGGQVAVNRSP